MVRSFAVLLVCNVLGGAAEPGAVEYGKSLVKEVANCGDCHTPRAAGGGLDQSRWLKGALPPKASPDLTASSRLFLQWGEKGMVKFLETGIDPAGRPAPSHMPAFKLRPHDAEAIVAYLRTVK
jgi:D-sorbitol dehydrogenase (acceptor)